MLQALNLIFPDDKLIVWIMVNVEGLILLTALLMMMATTTMMMMMINSKGFQNNGRSYAWYSQYTKS
jgi:hypothetical protein